MLSFTFDIVSSFIFEVVPSFIFEVVPLFTLEFVASFIFEVVPLFTVNFVPSFTFDVDAKFDGKVDIILESILFCELFTLNCSVELILLRTSIGESTLTIFPSLGFVVP